MEKPPPVSTWRGHESCAGFKPVRRKRIAVAKAKFFMNIRILSIEAWLKAVESV
jgi:hypothetical protein